MRSNFQSHSTDVKLFHSWFMPPPPSHPRSDCLHRSSRRFPPSLTPSLGLCEGCNRRQVCRDQAAAGNPGKQFGLSTRRDKEEEISLLLFARRGSASAPASGPVWRINLRCAEVVSLLFASLSLLRAVNVNGVERRDEQT